MLLFWSSIFFTLFKYVHLTQSGGYLEWCEEPESRKRVSLHQQCTTLSFVYPFPPCICLKGAMTVNVEGTDLPKLILSDNGCFNQKSDGTMNRTLRLERTVNRNNYLVTLLNQNKSDYKFYEYDGKHRNQVLFTNSPYYVYNGDVIDLLQEYKGKPVLCVQLNQDKDKKDTVQYYGLNTFPEVYLLLNKTCDGGSSVSDTDIISSVPLYTAENSQCVPTCPAVEEKKASPLMLRVAVPDSKAELPVFDPMEQNMAKSCKEIPPSLRSLHQDLNRRMMSWSIERAFHDGSSKLALKNFQPSRSFKILEKLVKITERFCREAQFPKEFLYPAVEYFKIAHQGRGFVFAEDFKEAEYKGILKFLSKCLWDLTPLKMNTQGCPQDNIWVQSVYKPGSEHENYTVVPTRHHQYFDHHVVLDISWNMVDLANEVCLKSFSSSLRMYHVFEQGMEKLFTADLRNFWLYPETEPHFYDRLFGSAWISMNRNLEKCIDAAYLLAGKSRQTRLNRPTWISGVNTKRGTAIAPICERKRTDLPLISSTHEIYCNVQQEKKDGSFKGMPHLDFPLNPEEAYKVKRTTASYRDPEDEDSFIDWIDVPEPIVAELTWPPKTTPCDDDKDKDSHLTWPPVPPVKIRAHLIWPPKSISGDDKNKDTHLTWPPPPPANIQAHLTWPPPPPANIQAHLTWPPKSISGDDKAGPQ